MYGACSTCREEFVSATSGSKGRLDTVIASAGRFGDIVRRGQAVALAMLALVSTQCDQVTAQQSKDSPGSQLAPGQPTVEVVARGLAVPWALAFASGGRLFVTERPGRIRLVADGRLQREPIAVLLAVTHGIETGLLGLALDPRFDDNGFLYVCYTTATPGGGIVNRVSRLTFRDGVAANETVVIDLPGTVQGHNGCRVKFGPDGKLYVSMGDQKQRELAQQAGSLAGKIIRVNANGSVPTDNPFAGSPVYALGLRNPQGLAFDRKGRLIASDHGGDGHDEINHIRPGANYGWPRVEGKAGDARYTDPIIESGDDTWAPSGIAIRGDELFVTNLKGERLLRMTLGPDLEVTHASALLVRKYGRLRDVVVGPDGALYITTSNGDGGGEARTADDRILKVTP